MISADFIKNPQTRNVCTFFPLNTSAVGSVRNYKVGGGGLREYLRNTFWSKLSAPSISKDVIDSGTDISRTSTAEAMEAEDSATVSLIGLIIKKGNIKIGKNYKHVGYDFLSVYVSFSSSNTQFYETQTFCLFTF